MAQTLIAILLMFAGSFSAARQADTCCASVDARIIRNGDEHRIEFANHAAKNVVAFTFKWDSGQFTSLLFGAPFRDTYSESAHLQWQQGDSPVRLASVAFDDGSFEGDAESAQWNLTALKAAEETHRKWQPRLRGVLVGEVSADTALDLLEASPVDGVRRMRITEPDDMARDFGKHEAESLYRSVLTDKAHLRQNLEMLDRRFSMMRREAK